MTAIPTECLLSCSWCHWALRWWQLYQQNVSSLAPDGTEHWDDDSYTNRMSPLLFLMSLSTGMMTAIPTECLLSCSWCHWALGWWQLYQQNVSSLVPDVTEHWDDDSYTNRMSPLLLLMALSTGMMTAIPTECLLSCSWCHWALGWWQLYQQNVSSLAPDGTEHWDDDSYTNRMSPLLLLMALSTEMMTAIPTECLLSCSWWHWALRWWQLYQQNVSSLAPDGTEHWDDDSYTNRMSPLLFLMSLSTEMMTAIPTECLLSCSWCHWALRWWQLYQQNASSLAPGVTEHWDDDSYTNRMSPLLLLVSLSTGMMTVISMLPVATAVIPPVLIGFV